MGLSVESPLAVAVNAGCTALPALLNIKQVNVNSFYQSNFVNRKPCASMANLKNIKSYNIGYVATRRRMGSKR